MLPLISQIASLGYTASQILKFISGKFKNLSPGIQNAQAQGYSPEDILKFIGGKMKPRGTDKQLSENESYLKQQGFKTKEERQESRNKFISGAFQVGATALGAYALNRALPKTSTALQGQLLPALSNSPTQQMTSPLQLPAPGQATIQPLYNPNGPGSPLSYSNPTAQGMPSQSIKPPTPPIQPQETAQEAPIQPQATAQAPTNPLPPALHKITQDSLEAGNTPQQVEALLKFNAPKEVKAYEKATNTPIRSAIEEFSKSLPAKVQTQPMGAGIQEAEQPIQGKISEPSPILEKKPKVEERKKVALPNGDIGEITNIRQGIATVNANGKEYRRKLEELIESPIPEKDLADLYEDLSKGIEAKTGEELSRMANLVGYDAKERALIFHPTGPKAPLYGYLQLNDEEVKELMETQALRKTSGENYVGAWKEGTKSVYGSKLSAFIRKLQESRGGKGSEYGFKFDLLYDAMEPAKLAKKEKFDEKQAALRSEKKAVKQAEKQKAKAENKNLEKIKIPYEIKKHKSESDKNLNLIDVIDKDSVMSRVAYEKKGDKIIIDQIRGNKRKDPKVVKSLIYLLNDLINENEGKKIEVTPLSEDGANFLSRVIGREIKPAVKYYGMDISKEKNVKLTEKDIYNFKEYAKKFISRSK